MLGFKKKKGVILDYNLIKDNYKVILKKKMKGISFD